jgi:hypothetical protein
MKDNTIANDRLWTVNDVAEFFRASESWVRHAASAGKLPCVKISGFLRFEPRAIRAMVEQAPEGPVRRSTTLRF